MRRFGPALLAIGLFGPGAGCSKHLGAPPIVWHHNIAVGRALAAAQGKPMLVYFHADWDMSSQEMETHTFADADVRRTLAHFIAVEVDCTDDESPGVAKAERELGVVGVPTLVVLAPDLSTELGRWNQYVPPATLAGL